MGQDLDTLPTLQIASEEQDRHYQVESGKHENVLQGCEIRATLEH